MRNTFLLGTILIGLSTGYALTFNTQTADAGPGKNIKVYPADTDKKVIKKDMKILSKALGVKCDFCHNMAGMDKDTDMKIKARSMMRMTNAANSTLKKDGFKKQVTCNTCHLGAKEPKN